jgi:imidazole glycerol-phosphate synthase subunit HisF
MLMLKIRIIPILSFNGFALVKTKQFENPRMVGNPTQVAKVYNSRNVDELVFVDIFASKQKRKINLGVVKQVINECFMPVTIGGGINSIDDINNLLKIGADKVVLKSIALENPSFIKEAVKIFGSQCIVVSVDVKTVNNEYKVYHHENNVNHLASDFIKEMEDLGAGELFINDVKNDGMMNGFDSQLFKVLSKDVNIPIIACGGASKPEDFSDLLEEVSVTGVAGASIFHYTQFTPFDIKYAINQINLPVRLFDYHLSEGVNK